VDVALVGVAALLMGLVAAVVPLRRIAQVDPAVVFRA
jgi:ABC-type lipoprotein release transport system permease subunit